MVPASAGVARPFLKWAGGKGQLLPQLEPCIPAKYGTYFEPFLGGGALFFRLRPPHAVLADSNPELMAAFLAVRDDPEGLMELLDGHSRKMNKAYFLRQRKIDPTGLAPLERAARLVFLNKTCYNGLYRVNAKGEFNVPYGGDYYPNRKPILYERQVILAASRALQAAELVAEDYQAAIQSAHNGDLVYFDPPYHPVSDTARFTSYTKEDFGDAAQRELARAFRDLDERGVKVMLSNSGTDLVRALFSNYRVYVLKARRAINSNATRRGPVDELLVTNFPKPRK